MRTSTLSPRPNLYFQGEQAVVSWFLEALHDHRKSRSGTQGPQALIVRDNGFPQRMPASKLDAVEFIHVVGIYNGGATAEQVLEDIQWFWVRNIGGRDALSAN